VYAEENRGGGEQQTNLSKEARAYTRWKEKQHALMPIENGSIFALEQQRLVVRRRFRISTPTKAFGQ
jgi:hypothetical protein